MPTRFYFLNTTASGTKPDTSSGLDTITSTHWLSGSYGGGQDTSSVIYPLDMNTTSGNSNVYVSSSLTEPGVSHSGWGKAFISPSLSAQTMSSTGTFVYLADYAEGNTNANLYPVVACYLWKPNNTIGATIFRGTSTVESPSTFGTLTSFSFAASNVSQTTVSEGDRIVVEAEFRNLNAKTAAYVHGFGWNGAASSGYETYVEFSQELSFKTVLKAIAALKAIYNMRNIISGYFKSVFHIRNIITGLLYSSYNTKRLVVSEDPQYFYDFNYEFNNLVPTTFIKNYGSKAESIIGLYMWDTSAYGDIRTTGGKVNKCLRIDTNKCAFVVPTGTSVLSDWTTQFTIEAWFNFDSVPITNQRGITKALVTDTNGTFALMDGGVSGTLPSFHYRTNLTAWADGKVTGTTNLEAGVWYHVCVTYDGSWIRLYVNGIEEGSKEETGNLNQNTTYNLYFGRLATTATKPMTGYIDYPAFYDKALTTDQIKQRVNLGYYGAYKKTSYNINGIVEITQKYIYNILSSIVAENVSNFIYNIRNTITGSYTHLYTIRNYVTGIASSIWNIRNVLSNVVNIIYNVLNITVSTTGFIYNVFASVSSGFETIYNLRNYITGQSKMLYHISNILSDVKLTAMYNIRYVVEGSSGLIYNLENFVFGKMVSIWHMRNTMSAATTNLQYAILGIVSGATEFLYVIRNYVTSTSEILCNIREFVFGKTGLIYSVGGLVSSAFKSLYNIREFVSGRFSMLYHIFTMVTAARETAIYNIRGFITTTTKLQYNLYSYVIGAFELIYTIVGKPWVKLRLIYNVNNSVWGKNSYLYNINKFVGGAFEGIWNLRGFVSGVETIIYDIRNYVSEKFTAFFTIRNYVTGSIREIYNILNSVVSGTTIIWNLRNAVTQTRRLVYTISETIISVSLGIIAVYNVRNIISTNKSSIYNIRVVVSAIEMRILYSINKLVESGRTLQYTIWNYITGKTTYIYTIAGRLAATMKSLYNIRTTVEVFNSFKYTIRMSVETFSELLYTIRNSVVSTSISSWNIWNLVSSPKKMSYNIRNIIEKTTTLYYNILNRINNFFTSIYRLGGGAISRLKIVYTLRGVETQVIDPYNRLFDELYTYLNTLTEVGGEFENLKVYRRKPSRLPLFFPCLVIESAQISRGDFFGGVYKEGVTVTIEVLFKRDYSITRQLILMKEQLARYYRDRLVSALKGFESNTLKIQDKQITGVIFGPSKPNHTLYGARVVVQFAFEGGAEWEQD